MSVSLVLYKDCKEVKLFLFCIRKTWVFNLISTLLHITAYTNAWNWWRYYQKLQCDTLNMNNFCWYKWTWGFTISTLVFTNTMMMHSSSYLCLLMGCVTCSLPWQGCGSRWLHWRGCGHTAASAVVPHVSNRPGTLQRRGTALIQPWWCVHVKTVGKKKHKVRAKPCTNCSQNF